MKLIPVTERLPEIDQDVIAFNGKRLVAAKYVKRLHVVSQEPFKVEDRGDFQVEKYPGNMDRAISSTWVGITHWMPAIIDIKEVV